MFDLNPFNSGAPDMTEVPPYTINQGIDEIAPWTALDPTSTVIRQCPR